MKRTTVRFSWLNFSCHEFLVECTFSNIEYNAPRWVISRIEPRYKPTESESKSILAFAPYALDSQHVALYFSDESEKAIRDLEIANKHLEICQLNYEKAKNSVEKAETRLNSIRREIMEKFQK
jgi:hypothetical protein